MFSHITTWISHACVVKAGGRSGAGAAATDLYRVLAVQKAHPHTRTREELIREIIGSEKLQSLSDRSAESNARFELDFRFGMARYSVGGNAEAALKLAEERLYRTSGGGSYGLAKNSSTVQSWIEETHL